MKFGRVLPVAVGLLLGVSQAASAATPAVPFIVSNTPGHWFDAGDAWKLKV